jgi:predicted permease
MGRDLLYSLRVLRKSPRFASTAVLVLALGIGANSAIFTLVYSVLLRPLPYQDPARLAVILGTSEKRGGAFSVPPADYLDFRERNHSFSSIAAAEVWGPSLTGSGEAEELHGLRASASLFEVLGVRAASGRVFLPEDARSDATPVVVLGAGLFKRRLGGDSSAIGRTLTLNQASYTVVGVLPESFYFPPFWALDAEIYTPLVFPPEKAQNRDMSTLRVFGRLKPGVAWEQATADMRAIARSLAREYPRSNAEKSAVVTPLHEMAVGNVRASLTILLGAVGCTLLIACANLANLFLARATARHKEVAIRQALGAARSALVRQLMTESLLVCFAGGALGLLIAWWAVGAFVGGLPAAGNFRMPRHREIALGAPVIAFNFAVCLVTGLLLSVIKLYSTK